MINREDLSFLKVLQAEMLNQETDCQAAPRFWVLRQYEYEPTGEDWMDKYEYIYTDDCMEFEGLEDFIDFIERNERFSEEHINELKELETLEQAFDYMAYNGIQDGFDKIPVVKVGKIIPNTLFLTKKAAKDHIKANYYHYNETVHTYAMTAWRSPEVENLFRIIENLDLEELERVI